MASERVMIIDDNKVFLEELKETLSLCGYDAKAVYNSANALKIARKIRPNVILLDLKMNGASGFQVAEELKRSKETAKIPIIAMSGYFPIENQSTLLDMHNTDARIKKPFSILEIISEIETVMKTRTDNDLELALY